MCTCTVDNSSLKLEDYLSAEAHKPCSISHMYVVGISYDPLDKRKLFQIGRFFFCFFHVSFCLGFFLFIVFFLFLFF